MGPFLNEAVGVKVPFSFCIFAMVSAFSTTWIIPTLCSNDMQLYGFILKSCYIKCPNISYSARYLKSRPSLFHNLSMILSICNVNMSCLRSSPFLKMIYTSCPKRSELSNTIHKGLILLSITRHFSILKKILQYHPISYHNTE